MPASYGNFPVPYNPPGRPPLPNATDLHLKAVPPGNIDLIGVNGVGPDNPAASYNAEGSGTGEIDLSGINVAAGGNITVRIKGPGAKLPTLSAQWTVNNVNAGVAVNVSIAMGDAPPTDGEPVFFADALESIFELAGQALATGGTGEGLSLEEDVAPTHARRTRQRTGARG